VSSYLLEYPGYEAHSGTPDDTESYNLLLQAIREKLDKLEAKTGKKYGLTAALPCGTPHIKNIDIETVSKYLSEFNIMTYDFFGAWSPITGVNAPLYDQDWDDFEFMSVDGCVKQWVKGGADPSRINIGLVSMFAACYLLITYRHRKY
jgi:chitinase